MKRFLAIFIAWVVLCVGSTASAALLKVNVFTLNDFHGHFLATQDSLGAAQLASALTAVRRQYAKDIVLTIGGGDLFSGTAEANFTQGLATVRFLSDLRLDADVVGNHMFDFSQEVMVRQMKAASFPLLAANITFESGKHFFPPYVMLKRGGLKIAVIGLTTGSAFRSSSVRNQVGLKLVLPENVAQRYIDEVRVKGAHIVILACHIGSEMDSKGNVIGEILALVPKVQGVDAIISGHSHQLVAGTLKGVPIVQARCYGSALGHIQLLYDTELGKVVGGRAQCIDKAQFPRSVDPKVARKVENLSAQMKQAYGSIVGYTQSELTNEVHGHSPVSEVLLDAVLSFTGAQIALDTGGAYRSGLKAGVITLGDLHRVYPFRDGLYLVRLTGKLIRQAVEHGLANRKRRMIRFSGLKVKSSAEGSCHPSITLSDGETLVDEKEYLVVVSEYLLGGGSGYAMLKGATIVRRWPDQVEAFAAALTKAGKINYHSDGRLAY